MFDEGAPLNYDATIPAGQDDYPTIKIYGSCKTCEAYILDYFAEEVFVSMEEFLVQGLAYMSLAVVGFVIALIAYIKYRVSPTAENEIELLGGDGGVMA